MTRKQKSKREPRRPVPKVRIAFPKGRLIQLRYLSTTERREIRISTGTYDLAEAEFQKEDLEAKLRLGIETPAKEKQVFGPRIPWDQFREEYRRIWLSTLRDKSAVDSESRLDIAERILRPRVLADVADSDALDRLQSNCSPVPKAELVGEDRRIRFVLTWRRSWLP